MNVQHFGSHPVNIRIRINPKIWIRMPDHFWLSLDALAEVFYALLAQSGLYKWWDFGPMWPRTFASLRWKFHRDDSRL